MPRLQNISKYCVASPLAGCGVVERVAHGHALDRALLDAVDDRGLGQPGGIEHRRRDVDHVVELRADLALGRDALGPVDDRAVAGPAPVRGDLLGPLVRRVHRVRPADRVVVVRLGRPELVDLRRHELGRLERGGAVEADHLVERAVDCALGRRAVVADDVVDERVVEDVEVAPARRSAGRRGSRCARGTRRTPPSGARARA